jgi:hypothetical protein
MPLARTARRRVALIASGAPTTAITGHTDTLCRIIDITDHGAGQTSDGGGDHRAVFRFITSSRVFHPATMMVVGALNFLSSVV